MRFRKRVLALSALAAVASVRAAIAADAIWVPLGGSTSWNNTANWNTSIVPDGSSDRAYFGPQSGGPIVLLGGSTITLSTLDLSDILFTSITGGTINLTGPAIINADGANFDLPEKVIPFFGTTGVNAKAGNNLGGLGTLALSIIGSNGLNKTGDSHLQFDSPQFYTGTTTITGGGKIISTVGDSAFGNAANAIALNGGSLQIANTDWITSRTVDIGSLGGSLYWVGTSRNVDFSGNFTGSGSLQLNGRFALSSTSFATIHSNNSFNGTLNIGGGTVALRDSGAFANSTFINNSGTIILDHSTSAGAVNRLNDSATINMRGGALTFKTGTANYQESIGTLALNGGLSAITVDPGTGGASINLGTLTRGGGVPSFNNAAGLFVAGTNLGSAPGAGNANVFINNGTSLLLNGILPFAYGTSTLTSAESSSNGLLTYGSTGVTPLPLASYSSDLTTAVGTTYVRLAGSTSFTGARDVNALVLAAPDNLVVTSGAAGILLSGTGNINVTSGVVLSANAGLNGSGSTVTGVNSLPGNVISIGLTFGGKNAVIMTPAALRITGVIAGTGGLTKIGARTLTLAGLNTYTGDTVLTGFTRFTGNVPDNVTTSSDNPFGRGTSPIVIYGGNVAPSGAGFGELISDNAGSTFFNRPLDLRGDQVLLRSIGVSSLSLGTVNWNGTINISDPNTVLTFLSSKSFAHQIVNAPITGLGKVVIGAVDPNPGNPVNTDPEETWVDLMNAGTFAGGLVLAGGTIGIGNDHALGGTIELANDGTTQIFHPGTVQVSGNTLMDALGGARDIPNPFIVYGATLGIGTNGTATNFPVNLSGEINGRGGDYIANITNTIPTTFSGLLSGGGLTKTGSGTLYITHDNTFTGVMNVGNGSTAGGMVVITSDFSLGSALGPTGVDYGSTALTGTQNTLALDGAASALGGLNIRDETLFLRGSGVASLGALYNMSGNNFWRGTVSPSATYINVGTTSVSAPASLQFAAIGVASLSTLTLTRGIVVDDAGASNGVSLVFNAGTIGVRKVGPGLLRVGSRAILAPNGTTQFNGALIATGSLDVRDGTIAILSHSGASTLSNGLSVVDVGQINFITGTGTLASTPVGQLDLADNAMIIDYTGSSPLTTVRSYLKSGFAGGAWTGTGITSSMAASSPNAGESGLTAINYVESASAGLTSLLGDSFNGPALLLRYGYTADANFDGQVDVGDLTAMAQHWQKPSNAVWTDGDFTYDGIVDIRDLMLLAKNWLVGTSSPSLAPDLASLLASFGLPQNVPVPEPAQMLPVIFAGLSLLRPRRRRSCADAFATYTSQIA